MESSLGDDWAKAKCMAWKDEQGVEEQNQVPWKDQLLPCPCLFEQAYTDPNNFMVGADCNLTKPEIPCPLHPESDNCFVSVQPT